MTLSQGMPACERRRGSLAVGRVVSPRVGGVRTHRCMHGVWGLACGPVRGRPLPGARAHPWKSVRLLWAGDAK